MGCLPRVAEARQPDIEPPRPEPVHESVDRLRTADRDDGHALGVEMPAEAPGERLERTLVADTLDEHDRPGEWSTLGWSGWAREDTFADARPESSPARP